MLQVLFLQTIQAIFEHPVETLVILDRRIHRRELVEVAFMGIAAEACEQVLRTDVGLLVHDIKNSQQQLRAGNAALGEFMLNVKNQKMLSLEVIFFQQNTYKLILEFEFR